MPPQPCGKTNGTYVDQVQERVHYRPRRMSGRRYACHPGLRPWVGEHANNIRRPIRGTWGSIRRCQAKVESVAFGVLANPWPIRHKRSPNRQWDEASRLPRLISARKPWWRLQQRTSRCRFHTPRSVGPPRYYRSSRSRAGASSSRFTAATSSASEKGLISTVP